MMYIAGLNLHFTPTQALNVLSWTSTLIWFNVGRPSAESIQKSVREAGPTKFMPSGNKGKIASYTHMAGVFVPMLVFVVSLPAAGFHNPWWLEATEISMTVDDKTYAWIRLAGCAGTIGTVLAGKAIFRHLGAQIGMIGVRERHKVVNSGPYGIVRHPGYSMVLVQQLVWAAAFWNWMFIPAFFISAAAFAVKIPIEEKVMEDHKDIGDAYRHYKINVPYRIVPYIW